MDQAQQPRVSSLQFLPPENHPLTKVSRLHQNSPRGPLSSWKEIAQYVGKGVRTVQRWEQERGFPICRPGGNVILAVPDDIDAWILRGGNGSGDYKEELAQAREEIEDLRRQIEELRKTVKALGGKPDPVTP